MGSEFTLKKKSTLDQFSDVSLPRPLPLVSARTLPPSLSYALSQLRQLYPQISPSAVWFQQAVSQQLLLLCRSPMVAPVAVQSQDSHRWPHQSRLPAADGRSSAASSAETMFRLKSVERRPSVLLKSYRIYGYQHGLSMVCSSLTSVIEHEIDILLIQMLNRAK